MEEMNLENLTYFQLFEHFIKLHEQQYPQLKPTEQNKKQSYSLYEDLKLIIYCNQLSEIHNKDYKRMEEIKLVNRSYQSIKDRYITYLQSLQQNDLLSIAEHLKLKGLNGFLVFSNNQKKSLLQVFQINAYFCQISDIDPKSLEFQTERKKLREEEDLEVQKKVKLQGIKQGRFQKIRKTNSKNKENKSGKLIIKDPTYPKNEFDRFSIEDLDEVLKLIAQWKRVPKALIVEKLHQLSANMNDLDEYLNNLNEQYCWLEEEDNLLAQAQSRHSTEIRLLLRTKGLERVKRRIRFLGYQLPFELD